MSTLAKSPFFAIWCRNVSPNLFLLTLTGVVVDPPASELLLSFAEADFLDGVFLPGLFCFLRLRRDRRFSPAVSDPLVKRFKNKLFWSKNGSKEKGEILKLEGELLPPPPLIFHEGGGERNLPRYHKTCLNYKRESWLFQLYKIKTRFPSCFPKMFSQEL